MEDLNIAIGCDHGGFRLKYAVMEFLKSRGIKFKDLGIYTKEASDYPIIAKAVAKEVASGNYNRGILICGSGLGMAITANKVKGIRAITAVETYSARVSRAHNNANILCLGERVIGENLALDIVDVWLKSEFEGGRHQNRINMIEGE